MSTTGSQVAAGLRYGVIGTGMMGCEHIANIAHLNGGAQVTAVADPYPESLQEASLLAPAASTFSDYRDMLDADVCDVVVISTPNMTHAAVLRDVLGSDLNVLVEKPLCTEIEDCLEVIELAGKHRGLVWVGLEYRFMAPFARLISEVHSGRLGRIRMASLREHRFPFLDKIGDWNRFSENTGGTLVEKCCHFFDLMNQVMNAQPASVYASVSQMVNHLDESYGGRTPDITDSAYVIVDYDDGARGMLDLCMFAEATHNQQEFAVIGDAGKVEALVPEDVVRIGYRKTHDIGQVITNEISSDAPYIGLHHGSSYLEHKHFAEAIESLDVTHKRASTAASLEAGLLSVAMGVAGQLSAVTSKAVLLSDVIGR